MNNLDANVVLRFLLDDIPAQSVKASRLITTSQCYVSDVIFAEAAFVLERVSGFARGDAAFLLEKLIGL
jgi:predicted nucleic-acid-binding protein